MSLWRCWLAQTVIGRRHYQVVGSIPQQEGFNTNVVQANKATKPKKKKKMANRKIDLGKRRWAVYFWPHYPTSADRSLKIQMIASTTSWKCPLIYLMMPYCLINVEQYFLIQQQAIAESVSYDNLLQRNLSSISTNSEIIQNCLLSQERNVTNYNVMY